MLSETIAKYIHDLKCEFPRITSIWLIGSRANGTAVYDSDWDFLVFSSSPIYEDIRNKSIFHREDVDLLLVGEDEDGSFSKPFGEPKRGSLKLWKWKRISYDLSQYEGCKWIPDEETAAEGIKDMGYYDCQPLNGHKV